jgi:hypothetical protein
MQATARMVSVVSSTFPTRRRLIRDVRPANSVTRHQMKTLRATLFVIALIAFFSSTVFIAAAELSFAAMEDGDRVEITHSSKGCFHDTTLYYEVSRRDGASVFIQYAISWEKSIPPKVAERKVIGELKLTKSEIDGLDAFLRFYRGKKEASSTTQSSLLVEYFGRSKRVGVENLHDGSMGHGLENRKDVVQFFQLAARFQK